jgi:hypothetical protein
MQLLLPLLLHESSVFSSGRSAPLVAHCSPSN